MELRSALTTVAEKDKDKVNVQKRRGWKQVQGILSKGYLLEEERGEKETRRSIDTK